MDSSYVAKAQSSRIIVAGNQDNHVSVRDFTDDEELPSSTAACKTERNRHRKRNPTSASRLHYTKNHLRITQHTGASILEYQQPNKSSSEDDYNEVPFLTSSAEDQVILSNIMQLHSGLLTQLILDSVLFVRLIAFSISLRRMSCTDYS